MMIIYLHEYMSGQAERAWTCKINWQDLSDL